MEAPQLEEDKYAEFYEIDKPVIKFEGRVNEIQQKFEIAEEQTKDKIWSEVISWIEQGWLPVKTEMKGKAREVLEMMPSLFDPEVFNMKDGVLIFTKAASRNRIREVWRIFLPESMVKEVWSLCNQSDLGEHRGLEGTLNKFHKGFFLLSARLKLQFLNGGCDTCLTKERSTRSGLENMFPMGYVGKKLYIDLLSLSYTVRGN